MPARQGPVGFRGCGTGYLRASSDSAGSRAVSEATVNAMR